MDGWLGWRAVFVMVTALSVATAVPAVAILRGTLPPSAREPLALRSTVRTYGLLLTSPGFVWPLTAVSALFAMVFAYIGGVTYALQEDYGLRPAEFGAAYGATAVAAFLGATDRSSPGPAPVNSTRAHALVGVAVAVTGFDCPSRLRRQTWCCRSAPRRWGVGLVGLGIATPPFFSSAMSSVTTRAGTASAVFGAVEFVLGGLAAGVGGALASGSVVLWLVFVLAAAIAALPPLCARDGTALRFSDRTDRCWRPCRF